MVELVVTLVVLGVIAAVAVPRLTSSGFDERGLRDKTLAALRYAQKSAMAARRTVCATFTTSPTSSVAFTISSAYGAADCSTGSALAGPDGTALAVTASGSAAFASAPASVVFDAAGRPGAAASISVSGLDSSLAVTIEAETGYVH